MNLSRLKRRHLQLSLHDVQLAEIMGLFHDVGRFRQYSIYKTFNDAQSEDHADLGLKVGGTAVITSSEVIVAVE